VAYAFVANVDEGNSKTLGFLRSTDGGQSWQTMGGSLANPTTTNDCSDLNVGRNQSGYNQGIVVDPTNPQHLLVAGCTCALRVLNALAGSPTWENVAGWYSPFPVAGSLAYAHADWHILSAFIGPNGLRIFGGNDGGLYSSLNVFDPSVVPSLVTWAPHHRSMSSIESYALGSGDPANGNPSVMVVGTQDLGTGYRRPSTAAAFDYVCC
jgi:hypothetical protein